MTSNDHMASVKHGDGSSGRKNGHGPSLKVAGISLQPKPNQKKLNQAKPKPNP
jgi:hypothetical protein